LPLVWGRRISSVFIGGGTPSLFSPDAIDQLLCAIRARLPLLPSAEITLEMNPGTVDAGHLPGYFQAGINRLSVGVQSFDDAALQRIGRVHNAGQAVKTIEQAQQAGFENINLDLMFALPGQTPATAAEDVRRAVQLGPTHISYYHLTIEQNTYFYHHPPVLPEDDDAWDIQAKGQEALAAAGYAQYEVSAYARQGFQCKHNLNYWRFGDYIGIGAGAHGKISNAQFQFIERRIKHRNPQAYIDAVEKLSSSEKLESYDMPFEFMLNALRLKHGFDVTLFEQATGLPRTLLQPGLQKASDQQLITLDGQSLHLTEKGELFLNDVMALFLAD